MANLPTKADIEQLMLEVDSLRAQLLRKCQELRDAMDCVLIADTAADIAKLRPARDRRKQA
jgi:hypothetical protein